ncbi:MAG: protein kinase domain-containing protein [Gemmatimonadaceae bacterium]
MTGDLRQQLSSTLGSAYALDRELGGGGMSRVFVADETALGRKVVVKVLQPELAMAVSVERFRREIQLAAQLQHPNIVPVLSAGVADGLPYYTMPYVEGESLRARMARTGPLSVAEVARVLHDVAAALSYSHERGVVHRDVKPDNILLARHHALVADFGVAKALSASAADAHSGMLTTLGLAMGTPAYMAPEQAAADPDTDQRADIYALGAVAYEMLTGTPLFGARSPSALLAAQVTEAPVPVGSRRPDLPPALAELVMRCLAKDPAARPQSAEEVIAALDQMTTPAATGATLAAPATPAGAIPISPVSLRRAAAVYAVALVVVVGLAEGAMLALGLPDWVPAGALVVMAILLPVVALTAIAHHAPVITPAASPVADHAGPAAGPVTAGWRAPPPRRGSSAHRIASATRPWLSWRRTTRLGAAAVGLFALGVAGHEALRALGIGPAGTLVARGVLGARDPVLVADFATPGRDSLLGAMVTEALRTDMSQSRVVSVVQPSAVRAALLRMQRPVDSPLRAELAHEIAAREGVKAVVEGEVTPVGGGFVLTARLVAPATGDPLASFRESAPDEGRLIAAIDRLSHRLREKAGESLKAIRDDRALDKVTTPSLAALRKYTEGVHALDVDEDVPRATALFEEAVRLDTNFAMAYRKLGVAYQRSGDRPSRQVAMLRKAYDLRDRLPEVESNLTIGTYHGFGPNFDPAKAIAAYDRVLEIDPKNGIALNNVALIHEWRRDFDHAIEYLRRASVAEPRSATYPSNLIEVLLQAGRLDEARRTLAAARARFPRNPGLAKDEVIAAAVAGDYAEAERRARALPATRPDDPSLRGMSASMRSMLALLGGRLAEAERLTYEASAAESARGVPGSALGAAVRVALIDIWFRNDTARGVRRIESALRATPLASLPELERPYLDVADAYALAGRPARARALLADFDRSGMSDAGGELAARRAGTAGYIAIAERHYPEAVATLRNADIGPCRACSLAGIAYAYDRAGDADSAIAVFERYLSLPSPSRLYLDPAFLAPIHKRLGELYEARGDDESAARHYDRFVDLWSRADPELRPQVEEVRRRLTELRPLEGRRKSARI